MSQREWLVAQDIDELVWLRLNRLTSVNLCEKILNSKAEDKGKTIDTTILHNKAIGMSSSIESSINYWNFKTDSLNLRILSRYYALLQMTIAEQVSSLDNNYDLPEIQKHTEMGHGLSNLRDPNVDFPKNYFVILLKSGYFHSYAKFLGLRKDINKIAFSKKPRDYDELNSTEKEEKLIPLTSLFRRIPELRPVIYEYLGLNPLSFHCVYDIENGIQRNTTKTILNLYPENGDISEYDTKKFNWPFKKVKINGERFKCEYEHPKEVVWSKNLDPYKSNYCGSSYIVPLKEKINDPILLNLMLLYSLSIIVRYLPSLWYDIYHGNINHIGSLIEYYISIFDHVIPLKMLERISEKRIDINLPGTGNSPI